MTPIKNQAYTLVVKNNAYWASMNGKQVICLNPDDPRGTKPNNVLVGLKDGGHPFWVSPDCLVAAYTKPANTLTYVQR